MFRIREKRGIKFESKIILQGKYSHIKILKTKSFIIHQLKVKIFLKLQDAIQSL